METRETLLDQLNETVSQLLDLYHTMPVPNTPDVYTDWTVKDVLGHIVFWHESFARNVRDLVNGIKPTPLKGKYSDLNQRCFDEMRTQTMENVMERLEIAHKMIQENILDAKLGFIPYKKGSRSYTPEEHLDIVNKHIKEHLTDIKKACQKTV